MSNSADKYSRIAALKELVDAGLITISQSDVLLELETHVFTAIPTQSPLNTAIDEVNKLDPHASWQFDQEGCSDTYVTIYHRITGARHILAKYPQETSYEALRDFLKGAYIDSSNKSIKPTHRCTQFVNQGFTSILMACKECGEKQPELAAVSISNEEW